MTRQITIQIAIAVHQTASVTFMGAWLTAEESPAGSLTIKDAETMQWAFPPGETNIEPIKVEAGKVFCYNNRIWKEMITEFI